MSRRIPNNNTALKRIVSSTFRHVFICEGPNEYSYLDKLVEQKQINQYQKGTTLSATDVELRIEKIKGYLNDESIEKIFWIVDAGDDHINRRTQKKGKKPFHIFYDEWLVKKDNEWQKLRILLNNPCLEYWFLLHYIEPPLDKKGNAQCFSNAASLIGSTEFNNCCPKGKGGELAKFIATKDTLRKNAIERAQILHQLKQNLDSKKIFTVASADIYQIFVKD